MLGGFRQEASKRGYTPTTPVKHSESARIPGIKELPTNVYPDHPPPLVANTPEAMVELAQMSVVEIHSWNGVARTEVEDDTFAMPKASPTTVVLLRVA